ncbi:MAG TPA: recombinase family protein [Gelidibacter sp.]|uniref:recombinase family protein n=1 Tax=Gelidibacter sp. TaxID=2018083 RepID=UPI002BB0484E|nr:recombinase family protein [Gelidibacter sp.]HXK00082.1 recombinase family protein [Gelidibacter sp.]
MRKADLYIRVSTDEQADKGYSQRDQEERLIRYCENNGVLIKNIYKEDHSAKTFRRPEWQKYLLDLRMSKSSDRKLLLFTKWDRFSRNAGDAYQTINELRKFEVEPVAIEQPLDLAIPENKIMLAFYLAAPEVENDRRALNVFHGMRRAKKEGRYMGPAPVGYVNKITEDKKKYIALHEFEAPILKWAFDQILANSFNTEQIWKVVREKVKGKGRFSKNNFWVALRNPVYCGKIFIPPYKDEEGYFVVGQHQPLISEEAFAEIQDILDGRTRVLKPKIVSIESLPLRGFLKCSKCERMLTGSASRGKMGKYYSYYHCSSSCGTRFKAELVNEAFIKQLRYLSPKIGMVDVFIEAFISDFNEQLKDQNSERANIINEIDKQNKRYQNALIKNADGEMDYDDFRVLKNLTKERIEKLEKQMNALASVDTEIRNLAASALKKVANIDRRYENGDIEEKRVVLSSMFPDFLVFDGIQHRTPRLNSAIALIYQSASKLQGIKKGTNLTFLDLSQQVT